MFRVPFREGPKSGKLSVPSDAISQYVQAQEVKLHYVYFTCRSNNGDQSQIVIVWNPLCAHEHLWSNVL
jgi:hypothetical protein